MCSIWPPSRARQVATRRCRLRKTFFNIRGVISATASVINRSRTLILLECRAKMWSLINSQRKKFGGGGKSGLRGSYNSREIMRVSKNSPRNLIVDAAMCTEAPSSWNQQYHSSGFSLAINCVTIAWYRSTLIVSLQKKEPTIRFLMANQIPTFCQCNPFSTNTLGYSLTHRQ